LFCFVLNWIEFDCEFVCNCVRIVRNVCKSVHGVKRANRWKSVFSGYPSKLVFFGVFRVLGIFGFSLIFWFL
jgi:hypothetical protein